MAPRGSPVARVDSSVRHVALRSVAAPPVRARSRSGYSNTNYIALGLVIEKATGHAYARELEKRILEPLGLDHTELPQTRRLPDLDDGGENPNVPWAAGAIVSNAHDLSRFYSALLSGRILSSATLATMKETVERVGLGIFSTDLPCGHFWGHDGGILDYQTLVSASEKGERIAVVSLRGPPGHLFVERALLCTEPPPVTGSAQASWKISFSSGPRSALRHECQRERAAVVNVDAQLMGYFSLVARWAKDRLRQWARRQRRRLRHECRRERSAEPDA